VYGRFGYVVVAIGRPSYEQCSYGSLRRCGKMFRLCTASWELVVDG